MLINIRHCNYQSELVVMGEDSWLRGHEFENRCRLLDGLDIFTFICWNNCNFYLKRPKINEKEAGDGPCFFKKLSIWTIVVNVHLKIPCTLGDISLWNPQSRNPSKSTHVWLLSFDLFETSSAHLQLLTWPALVPQNETLSTCLTLYFISTSLSCLNPFLPFSPSLFLYSFIFFHILSSSLNICLFLYF